jgi:mono/diheme cytochrome c family protein
MIAGCLACVAWLLALGLPCPATKLAAQVVEDQEFDDENPYRPGVIARYAGADGMEHVRLEEQIILSAGDAAPDSRMAPGAFRAAYDTRVLVQTPGVHRFRAYAAGHVRVKLADQVVLDRASDEPAWLTTDPIELPFGFHSLEVEFTSGNHPARLALFWEGPGFAFEPLAARWLLHESGATPDAAFERGRQLTRALRCAACHEVPGEKQPLAAPALEHVRGNLSRDWIVERLSERRKGIDRVTHSSRNMPHFAMSRDDAAAVADYLLSISMQAEPLPETGAAHSFGKKKNSNEKRTRPSAAAGATLFNSVGCLACHRVGSLGNDGLFGGGDLTSISSKRPAQFFVPWLAHPESINRRHRMPVFALSAVERESLSLYLQTLGEPAAENGSEDVDPQHVERGAAIVKAARCAACHMIPGQEATARIPLDPVALAQSKDNCLSEPLVHKRRPGYQTPKRARNDITTYLTHVRPPAKDAIAGRDVLAERNCLACHARGNTSGLAAVLSQVAAADESLAAALPLLRPPSLVGVGDKLHDKALAAAIIRSGEARQNWLRVRMPKFPLDEQEAAALVQHFIDVDRIPAGSDAAQSKPLAGATAIEGAGARLVTADGFGCTSCHAIGEWSPRKVAPGSEGAALSQIGRRVRREWFDRWVRNPVRIVPDMEMPSIVKPIRGVLDEDIDRQIAAIWHVLNRKGFTPPAPNALRIVRQSNMPDAEQRAAILTDVIEVGDVPFAKPLVAGLPNRHNVLYDLATGRLAAWWTGDTARQQTRGKTWFWEAGVPQLLPVVNHGPADGACELTLLHAGQRLSAAPHQQYITEFDTLEHVDGGGELTHRLHFPHEPQPTVVRLTQRFTALPARESGNDSGFRRRVHIESLPPDTGGEWLVLPGDVVIDASRRSATLDRGGTRLSATLVKPASARWIETERGAAITWDSSDAAFTCEVDYRAELAVDQFAPLPQVDRTLEKVTLDVVPGFAAVRLPLDDQCMPTGLAWRPDGTLIVASLEGRVWLARDSDGDGLEDTIAPFSDDLAAPYGVAATGDAIDVINKYGLLRLLDTDRDGRADRTEQIASGWGHTRDYHDWAVGLERDAQGNYYIALPCEQDKRSEAAAWLRGRALRLVPRDPTASDPRPFAIEEICAGLRFPQGLALSPKGELFATDNQGNYNPFNELNHLRPGKRYGFINSLEAKRGIKPPLTPPAIDIPHPWTRSVNGLCFLNVPGEGPAAARECFGPFAGHLVGCEYDTRRLVRMSLEQVDGEYQGAIYPLSREPAPGEETLEGPVSCAVSPAGDLFIGNLRDSGWGAGSNTGSIVRLRWRSDLPPGIAEVRARASGFTIEFTQPVEISLAEDASNYAISSYRRVSTSSYGGEDVDRRIEGVQRVNVADDGRSVTIDLPELREGFVYEFHLRQLAPGKTFFPAEAYYTLRKRSG